MLLDSSPNLSFIDIRALLKWTNIGWRYLVSIGLATLKCRNRDRPDKLKDGTT